MIIKRQGGSPFFGILILFFIIIMIWLAVTAVKGIFVMLTWLAIPLFVIALVLNYEVVTDYFKSLWRTLRKDPLKGIVYTGLSILGYPIVSAYLAFKAFMNNRWSSDKSQDESKGDYIKYKEIETIEEEEDFLELPQIEKIEEDNSDSDSENRYDDMF